MKETYEKTVLTVTLFAEDDVIVTSEVDRNNAYRSLTDLSGEGSRDVPVNPNR